MNLPHFGGGRPLVSSLEQFKKPAALNRYKWAVERLKALNARSVADAACGCGYGSWMIATECGAAVYGIDNDLTAHVVALQHWRAPGVVYAHGNIETLPLPKVDAVVSIETIEHVRNPRGLIVPFSACSKILLATVPHESIIPFSKGAYPHHYRHYTEQDVIGLLEGIYRDVEIEQASEGKELRIIARI